jgi:aspartyl-tRNA(Asn)/glutamyl-tRNA(Gln) amidotransferase subunit C
LSEQEKEKLTEQLSGIHLCGKAERLDLRSGTSSMLDISNVMRRSTGGLSQDQALANAPDKAAGHFRVPLIIE